MAETATVNKTITERTFLKYRVLIERVDMVPKTRMEWLQTGLDSPRYQYGPEYSSVEHESTKALEMEIREEIDLRNVVKALLWKDLR
jgi:hypothetical protein